MTVVVGAVSQLYQGDLDFGRRALERLSSQVPGEGVALESFDYGAVAVCQRLTELRPAALIVVGAAARDRRPGAVERRRVRPLRLSASAARQAIAEAVTGYVTIDLLLEVASALEALPCDTVTIELEPVRLGPGVELSPPAEAALEKTVGLVRAELRRHHASSRTPRL